MLVTAPGPAGGTVAGGAQWRGCVTQKSVLRCISPPKSSFGTRKQVDNYYQWYNCSDRNIIRYWNKLKLAALSNKNPLRQFPWQHVVPSRLVACRAAGHRWRDLPPLLASGWRRRRLGGAARICQACWCTMARWWHAPPRESIWCSPRPFCNLLLCSWCHQLWSWRFTVGVVWPVPGVANSVRRHMN